MGIIDKEGALYWATGIDTSGLKKDAKEVKEIFDDVGKGAEKAGEKVDKATDDMEEAVSDAKDVFVDMGKETKEVFDNIGKDAKEAFIEIDKGAEKTRKAYDNMNIDAQEAGRIFEGMAKDAEKASDMSYRASVEMQRELQSGIAFQKAIIDKITEELKLLQAEFQKVNFGTNDAKVLAERERLKKAISSTAAELRGEKDALMEMQNKQEELAKRMVRLRTELTKTTDQLARMKLLGEENSKEYKELEEKAREYKETLTSLNEEQRGLTESGRKMQGLVQGLSALSGVLASGAGAMGLLTSNTEKYEKIQTRVQSLISLTIGLQQVQNALDESSAFRVHTVTKAKQLLATANLRLATALGISTAAAQLLMGTLTLGLSVAIGIAIAAYDKFITKQREAKETQKKLNESISSGISSQIADYERLRVSYNKLGDDVKAKEKFITDNQSAFNKLGVAIDGVNDADTLFILQTEAFKAAIDQRARATAAMEIAAEKYKEAFRKREEAEQEKVTSWNYTGATLNDKGQLVKTSSKSKKLWDETNKLQEDAQKYINNFVEHESKAIEILKNAGIKAVDKTKETVKDLNNEVKINYDKLREDILRYEKEYQNKLQELESTAEQIEINRKKDSNERELAQIEFNYKQRLQVIDRAEQNELDKLIEAERKKAMLRGDKSFDPSAVRLPAEMTDFYNMQRAGAKDDRLQSEESFYNAILEKYKTFEQQRLEIAKKYDQERTLLASQNIDGKLDKNIEELNKKEIEELAQFDNAILQKSSILARMFADMSDKSIAELKEIQKEAEELWKFLSGGEWDESKGAIFGITKAQFDDIISDPDKLSKFKKGVDDIKGSILQLDSPLKQIKEGFKQLFSSDNKGTAKTLEGLNKIQQGYNKYADAVGLVSGAVSALGDLTNSGVLKSIGEGLNDVLGVADGAMQGAQTGAAFGPAGAIVGAVVGAAKEALTVLSRNKKHREELRRQIKEHQQEEYFGQLEIEQLWRQKYEWAQKIGESTLNYLKREGEELKKQTDENAKAQADLWKQLTQQQYKSGEYFKRTGMFGWGKGKIVEQWSSLAGKTWEDIEKLATQGKLSAEGMKFYEALKKAKEEGADLVQMQEDYLEKLKETYTGSAYESVVSGIVQAFKNGERSAADFAKSFEALMQNAVESSLNLLANQEMRQWYEDFAEAGKDGYTKDEIEKAKKDWIALNEKLAEQAKQLEEVTGVKLGQTTSGVTGELKKEMTEGTASQLVGLWNMTAMDIRAIKEFFEKSGSFDIAKEISAILNELQEIRDNTGRTADNTAYLEDGIKKLENKLEEIRKNTKNNSSRA